MKIAPNVSRNCKHGSLGDSDESERGGGRVVTLRGKPINIGKSTIPHGQNAEEWKQFKDVSTHQNYDFLVHLSTLPITNTGQRKVFR